MKITENQFCGTRFRRAAIWLAVLSAWEYSGWAMGACTNNVSGAIDQNVPLGTCVYAPTISPANAALIVDGASGPPMVTASGNDTYYDTDLTDPGQVAPYAMFIRVQPLNFATQDAQLTLNGSHSLSVSAGTAATGMQVSATGVAKNAKVFVTDADLNLNVGAQGSTGIRISADNAASATVSITRSTIEVDTGGSTGIALDGANAALISSGTQNALTIGAVLPPTQFALNLTLGATVDFAGLLNFNSGENGIKVLGNSVLHLNGLDATRSSINVSGVPNHHALGLDYESSDLTAALQNVAVNTSVNTQIAGANAEGFNVYVDRGALAIQNVRLASNMIDGAALAVFNANVKGSGLAVDTTGKGTGGIAVIPNASGTITLDGSSAGNSIITRGAADYAPAYDDLPYTNAAAVRVIGGQISLASTDIETYGAGAPGIYLGKGALTTGAGVSIRTHGDAASGIVLTPLAGNTSNITAAFAPTTSVHTSGSGAYGFVADGDDLYDGTGTPHPFSSRFGSTGLDLASISVSGQGSAAIGARNAATLVLDGQNLSPLAALQSGTYAAEAESGGKIQFTAGATAGGASLLAGVGGTLDFNDDSTSASGSLVTISQGSSAATRGELDSSGRTQALHVGQLASAGSGSTNGLVNLGGNGLILDGSSATPATFSGAIEGTGGVTKTGADIQIFSGQGVFDYTGATQIDAGTLAAVGGAAGRDANGFKLFDLAASGTLDIGNNLGNFEAGAITGAGTVQLTDSGTLASSNLVLEGTGAAQTFAGKIVGHGGLVLRGSANQTLSGANVFGFTGDVTVGGGTLAVSGNAQASGNRFTFDDGANTGGTLDISGNGAAGFTLGGIEATNAATTAQIELGSTLAAPANLTLAGSGNDSFNGTISGYGNVVKEGSGTQTMAGLSPFAFNGTTVIEGGVLQLRNIADPSQFGGTFELDGGWLDLSDSTFDTTGKNANDWAKVHVTDGSKASNGGIIGGDDKIMLGGNAADSVEAAQIDNGVFVVKTGSNTTTLSGTNTYVGNTRILGGTLKVSSDANLGNTTIEREVVLDGGNLEIEAGDAGGRTFASARQLQLQAAGAVEVDGAASAAATLGSIAGAGQTFTKTGAGTLAFTQGGSAGQVLLNAGSLDFGSTKVDATTLAAAGQSAIEQAAGTTASLDGGVVVSQSDAIVAAGTSTLNLSGNAKISAGGAAYRVKSGIGTLNASGETLANNLLAADGSGTALAVHLASHSSYTGTPSLTGGAVATLSIDGSSAWNMTDDTALAGLANQGTITFGAANPTAAFAKAEATSAHQTLTVGGNYAGGGAFNMRTVLNAGGALADQFTDRLVVTGNVNGRSTLVLTTSGSGANTDTAHVNRAIPTEGISLVQVKGASDANAFALRGGYVAAQGSPYQYRLFAYGPGGYALPAASQSVLPDGTTPTWDYRLQTSYIDGSGNVQPGPGPYCCARPSVVPQVSSYVTTPLALQNYEATVMGDLYRRLGDVRDGAFDQKPRVDDVFARTIESRSMYHADRSFADYGVDFGQYVTAVQFGADWLHRHSDRNDFTLGTAATLGHSSFYPRAAAVESSDASFDGYSLALTGTWQRRDGWYADGVFSAGEYAGEVDSTQRGKVGAISATGVDGSVEAGRRWVLAHGVELEPHARMLTQWLHFRSHRDSDGLDVGIGDLFALTGLVGARISLSVPSTVSFRPYMRVDFAYTQTNSPSVTLSGVPFGVGGIGGAVQLGVGASGMVTPNFSVYGELSGQQRVGPGMSTLAATLGLRYSF